MNLMNNWKVPLADVTLGPEETAAVTEVLQSGWLSMGPKTQEFEDRFSTFLGVKHAFAVANGTAALHLACEVLGLGPGDEVLCPALTFVASANAILYTGARPVFVDVTGPDDLNLSVADAAAKVSERTRAIMVVHYGGYPADMDAIAALAARHGLKIDEPEGGYRPKPLMPMMQPHSRNIASKMKQISLIGSKKIRSVLREVRLSFLYRNRNSQNMQRG
jgi:dTDP-4-amino-4,6-dideoxygalactose transaminase